MRKQIVRSAILAFVAVALLAMQNEKLPAVNSKIISYVDKVMGKKVDRGECWDLVKYVLDSAHANWTAPDDFGKKLDPKKDVILPGDIVALKNVKYKLENNSEWNFPKHYAVIYKVTDKEHYTMANQNVNGKRQVMFSDLSLIGLKGSITFFRPQAK
ncbi:MAG TPA: hypothetical protein VK890_00105 [Bacteroidia bacterium]|jgi:hypothetical protein|nr:hypothetical protein [Bacteroidia bacterium]